MVGAERHLLSRQYSLSPSFEAAQLENQFGFNRFEGKRGGEEKITYLLAAAVLAIAVVGVFLFYKPSEKASETPRRSLRRLFPLRRLRLNPPPQRAAMEAPPKRKATRLRPRSQPHRPQQPLRQQAKHRRPGTKRMRRPKITRPRARRDEVAHPRDGLRLKNAPPYIRAGRLMASVCANRALAQGIGEAVSAGKELRKAETARGFSSQQPDRAKRRDAEIR